MQRFRTALAPLREISISSNDLKVLQTLVLTARDYLNKNPTHLQKLQWFEGHAKSNIRTGKGYPTQWRQHFLASAMSKVKWSKVVHLYSALITNVSKALYNDQFTQRTGSIYRRKLQPLLSSPCILELVLPTSEGWKAEWTLAGKKVAKYSSLGRTGNGTRDLRVGTQRSYHCANPSALSQKASRSCSTVKSFTISPFSRIDLTFSKESWNGAVSESCKFRVILTWVWLDGLRLGGLSQPLLCNLIELRQAVDKRLSASHAACLTLQLRFNFADFLGLLTFIGSYFSKSLLLYAIWTIYFRSYTQELRLKQFLSLFLELMWSSVFGAY